MGEMDMDEAGFPLEADTTTATGEQLSREEWAEQRRAEARAPLEASAPAEAPVHFEPPSHFATPSWLGPGSRDASAVAPTVPIQPEPMHDQLHAYAPTPIADTVPDAAHWIEHRSPRIFVGVLLTAAILGVLTALVFTVINQSAIAISALVVCAIFAVIFRGALMSSGLTTVDLQNATLRVREEGALAVFNLADPTERVEVSGTPGSSDWKVVLESINHRAVTLTAAHVNAKEFDRIVRHYRSIADRERLDRENRFNR